MTIAWESFVPDLIVGVVTGLVVGGILAWTQARASRDREKREIALRWEALRPQVGALLLDPWDRRVIGPSLSSFVSRTDRLRELLKDVPLASWAEVLDSSELRNLHEFVRAAAELDGAAQKFDGFLFVDILFEIDPPDGQNPGGRECSHSQAEQIREYALYALFNRDFTQPLSTEVAYLPDTGDSLEGIDVENVIKNVLAHPPVTYTEVWPMFERAEKYYGECAVSIGDAQMTRFWYH